MEAIMGRPRGSKNGQYTPKITLFMQKVNKTASGCWEWTGARGRDGYGKFDDYPETLAHREAWRLFKGDVPPGTSVLHHCDNPPCVNPDHLFLGTQYDNVQDCKKKGRRADCSGERNGRAKLNAEQVAEIRRRHAHSTDTVSTLAPEYGVSRNLIHQILSGHTWAK